MTCVTLISVFFSLPSSVMLTEHHAKKKHSILFFFLQLWTCSSKISQSLCSSTRQCWRGYFFTIFLHVTYVLGNTTQHETFFFCTNLPCRRHKAQQQEHPVFHRRWNDVTLCRITLRIGNLISLNSDKRLKVHSALLITQVAVKYNLHRSLKYLLWFSK